MAMMRDILPTLPLFDNLPTELINRISEDSTSHCYKKGMSIIKYHHQSHNLFYILDGWVKFYKSLIDGREVIIDLINASECFGENSIFNNVWEYYDAQAISDVHLLIIPIKLLETTFATNLQFSRNLINIISNKHIKLTLENEHVCNIKTAQRISCYLLQLVILNLYKTNDLNDLSHISLQLPFDKSHIAAKLGMRPETFSRALTILFESCNLKLTRDHLEIISIKKLEAYACKPCALKFLICVERLRKNILKI